MVIDWGAGLTCLVLPLLAMATASIFSGFVVVACPVHKSPAAAVVLDSAALSSLDPVLAAAPAVAPTSAVM